MEWKTRFAIAGMVLFSLPFCGVGLFALYRTLTAVASGDWSKAGHWSVFAVAFGLAGFGLLGFIVHSARRRATRERGKRESPREPWAWRDDWRQGRIRGQGKHRALLTVGFALFWNAVTIPNVVVHGPDLLERRDPEGLWLLMFPLIGLGLAAAAAYQVLRHLRYGPAVFEMASVPGVIGHGIRGTVRVRLKLDERTDFTLTLECVRREVRGSGKHRSVREIELWRDTREVRQAEVSSSSGTVGIPVAFAIPAGVRESDDEDPDNRVIWRLIVKSELRGIDYKGVFEVPVFRTSESDVAAEDGSFAELHRTMEREERDYSPPGDSRVVVRQTAAGTEIRFPARRNPAAWIFLALFTAVWTGFLYLIVVKGAPIMFHLAFGAFEVILLLILGRMLLQSRRITITSEELLIDIRYVVVAWTKVIRHDEIRSVKVARGMQAGRKVYSDLKLKLRDGRQVVLGRSIADRREARWIADRIAEAVGVPARKKKRKEKRRRFRRRRSDEKQAG